MENIPTPAEAAFEFVRLFKQDRRKAYEYFAALNTALPNRNLEKRKYAKALVEQKNAMIDDKVLNGIHILFGLRYEAK